MVIHPLHVLSDFIFLHAHWQAEAPSTSSQADRNAQLAFLGTSLGVKSVISLVRWAPREAREEVLQQCQHILSSMPPGTLNFEKDDTLAHRGTREALDELVRLTVSRQAVAGTPDAWVLVRPGYELFRVLTTRSRPPLSAGALPVLRQCGWRR